MPDNNDWEERLRQGCGEPVPAPLPSSGVSDAPRWTPGPWKAERANVGDRHPLFVVSPERSMPVWCDADAHLIAAAPDLYTALEWALAQIMGNQAGELRRYGIKAVDLRKAYDALAKARGEKPNAE